VLIPEFVDEELPPNEKPGVRSRRIRAIQYLQSKKTRRSPLAFQTVQVQGNLSRSMWLPMGLAGPYGPGPRILPAKDITPFPQSVIDGPCHLSARIQVREDRCSSTAINNNSGRVRLHENWRLMCSILQFL